MTRKTDRGDRKTSSVGYRRPPTQYQFRPGQSGNPSGRPKGARSFSDVLAAQAAELIRIRTGDRPERVTKIDALGRRVFQMALAGDLGAVRIIFQVLEAAKSGIGGEADDIGDPDMPNLETIRRMVGRFSHLLTEEK